MNEAAASMHKWEGCPIEELRQLAIEGAGGAHATCMGFTPPQSFKDFAKSIIEDEMGYEVDHWNYWASNLDPVDEGREWQLKFPHTHQWDGRTMILYLDEPEGGGELVVLDEDMTTELQVFEPKAGYAAVMRDHAIHGVKRIIGSKNRVTMIAGAYPYPKGSTKCRCKRQDWPRVTN
jgi:hypothetical protein